MPTVHGPASRNAPPVGPRPHFLEPRSSSLAVGSRKTGPTPHEIPPRVCCRGEKKKLCSVSERPVCVPEPGKISRCETKDRIVREIRLQLSFSENGITG